jgi:hypothetical protein
LKNLVFEPKRVLITVKAYPSPSLRYGETVCCAGVDIERFNWIRLYPVPFRDLEYEKRFRKYCIIEASFAKAPDDLRPESYRIKSDSIKILEFVGTRNEWERRKSIVLRLPIKSHCQVIKDQKLQNLSLGLIKPADVTFSVEKRSPVDEGKKQKAYAQGKLFGMPKEPIEDIPYQFYFRFRCRTERNCPSHNLSIIDWEIYQAFRQWRYQCRNEQEVLRKIAEKWMALVDGTKKDPYFYVGNLHRFPRTFMVLGVFYPPLKVD